MPDADRMCAAVTSASRTTLLSYCRGGEPAFDLLGGRVRLMPRRYSAEPTGASAGGGRRCCVRGAEGRLGLVRHK